ncbi:hypothetical protein CWR43_28275 [Rhizobium sullae]|uniref:CAP-Gly domain protein n=1 Tax=Rhizobium sullae TaxID=50338 RepID=A0A2N0D350_RHISU|nr:hypothetical protein [Rhizobium sullae]PKA40472.1 hypothetical protein CWR43_28275 [Rhizobium sullae]
MTGTYQFHVGMDVVCISASQPAHTSMPSDLVEGATYKLRWVGMHEHYVEGEYLGVRLEGIHRGTCRIWGDVDTPFRATRFRPLVRDRLGGLRALLAGGPVAPSIDDPQRVTKKVEEKV